jgi:GntR family transcriptional regulator
MVVSKSLEKLVPVEGAKVGSFDQLGFPIGGLRRKALPRQVRDAMAAFISSELRPGDPLPAEMAVAQRLQVSRSTVREAMKLLEQEGLVDTRRGTGRFASALAGLSPERPMTKFESISRMMAELGYDPTTVVVAVTEREATLPEQLAFSLPHASSVIETRRLRLHQGSPCIYSINVLDVRTLEQAREAIDWSSSVNEILERFGYDIVASSAHISVVDRPLPEDSLEEISDTMGPWLVVNEQCVTRTGRCVLVSRDYHLGGMFSFSVVRRREDESGFVG